MKTKRFLVVFCTMIMLVPLYQCEKYGNMNRDDDSDAPPWAGGNTDVNPHINKNEDSGTTRGGDYGDLFVLLRDNNGVPEMTQIGSEWYVQPVDVNGLALELDAEGELVNPELAIEVNFGRLNIVRSPESVLDQAFEEALKLLTSADNISLDFCGRLTAWNNGTIIKTIDSPRENMALYRYLMKYMFKHTAANNYQNRLAFLGQSPYNFDPLMLAASCIAAGSDKTGYITIDEVVYINGFIDCIGLNPILNEHEYDWNHDNKYYFNFGDCDGGGMEFQYNRPKTYKDRYIQLQVWDNVYYPIDEFGNCSGPIFPINYYFELHGLFSHRWGDIAANRVSGFALAADDAVQVLDFIHEDSNIRFLPGFAPPNANGPWPYWP